MLMNVVQMVSLLLLPVRHQTSPIAQLTPKSPWLEVVEGKPTPKAPPAHNMRQITLQSCTLCQETQIPHAPRCPLPALAACGAKEASARH